MFIIIFPGLGYRIINERIVKLQPWNYLIQIAEDLAMQGYNVKIVPIDAYFTYSVRTYLWAKEIEITPFNRSMFESNTIIIPIAIGFITKLESFLKYKNDTNVIGVLTTPLMDMPTLISNFIRVKLTRTDIAANNVLYENLMFRLKASIICKHLNTIIVPSDDYKKLLSKILPCNHIRILKFLPRVYVPQIHDADIDSYSITYFGPFSEERGIISLIKAFIQIIKEEKCNTKLTLLIRDIGSRNIVQLYQLINKINNINLCIRYLSKKELFSKLSKSYIIVLPYRLLSSTVPLAFLESLILNKTLVISTNIWGISEHVRMYMSIPISPKFTISELKRVIYTYIMNTKIYKNTLTRQIRYSNIIKNTIITQSLKL